MDIGIIGSGKMGAGLGRLWAKHGHHVMFSYSRTPDKLENLVLEIGSHARSGTPRDVVGFANILHTRAHLCGRNMPSVFYCGNDRDAKSHTANLIRDAGLQPVDAGALGNARYIEPLAMLMMELGQSQHMGSDIALRLMNPA